MSDRSMGRLQEADEERKRRMENPDDWPQIKARLESEAEGMAQFTAIAHIAADIRAALQRDRVLTDENKILRQRVEELERRVLAEMGKPTRR